MTKHTVLSVALILTTLFLAPGLSAHHAFSLEYDATKPVKFEGVVSRVEWTNPHARIHIDVTEPGGTVVRWNIELASLSALVRNGWTRTTVKAGERVKVEGFEGRGHNTHRMTASAIVTADGRSLFSGTAGEEGRPAAPGR